MNGALKQLISTTYSVDDDLRNASVTALVAHASDDGVQRRLAELLESESADTNAAAARVLLEGAGRYGLEIVLAYMAGDVEVTRQNAIFRVMADVRSTVRRDLFIEAAALVLGDEKRFTGGVLASLLLDWTRMQDRPFRDLGAEPSRQGERTLGELLSATYAPHPLVQWAAMDGLGDFGPDDLVLRRLGELLDAGVIETFVLASEILLRRCGTRGLEIVMDELVRREDDGQIDYIWYKMGEVHATQRMNLYREAFLYAEASGSAVMREIVDELITVWNGMQEQERHLLNTDGTMLHDGPAG